MGNNIKYIAEYQKANTIQVNIRLSKKYDADVIEKLNSLDNTGKSTYIKRLIREDIARANGVELPESHWHQRTYDFFVVPLEEGKPRERICKASS